MLKIVDCDGCNPQELTGSTCTTEEGSRGLESFSHCCSRRSSSGSCRLSVTVYDVDVCGGGIGVAAGVAIGASVDNAVSWVTSGHTFESGDCGTRAPQGLTVSACSTAKGSG